jgi:hypothetical protein
MGRAAAAHRTAIVFDFSGPRRKNTTDTVKLLVQMARYQDLGDLRTRLDAKLICAAEAKLLELRGSQPE